MYFDLPLEQLKTYKPERTEPADFDLFWKTTIEMARSFPLDATFEPVETGLKLVEVFDVTFNGYGGQPVKGWLVLPCQRTGKLPCVVEYIGYGGGRGLPFDWLSVGFRRLRPFRHGHPRPGQHLVERRHARHRTRRRQPADPRLHDARHPQAGDVLLPARLHRRGSARSKPPAVTRRWIPPASP